MMRNDHRSERPKLERHVSLAYLALALSVVFLILCLMAQYSRQLDGIFQALADPTRRAVLGQLGRGPASISELAKPFDMALPSFMKHIHSLEDSGWIQTHKEGRVRTCVIEKKSFAVVEAWLSEQRELWEGRTDRLEQFVTSIHEREESE